MENGVLTYDHYKGGLITYRKRALRHFGKKCVKCSYDKDERMLDVHHIDGQRGNSDMNNLEVLCVWCHALGTRDVPFHMP